MEYPALEYDSVSTTADLTNQNTSFQYSSKQATTDGVYNIMEWIVSVSRCTIISKTISNYIKGMRLL